MSMILKDGVKIYGLLVASRAIEEKDELKEYIEKIGNYAGVSIKGLTPLEENIWELF